jgi:hypothetical protein
VLLVSLPVIGWRTHPAIGAATLGMLILLGLRLRLLIRVAVAGALRKRS